MGKAEPALFLGPEETTVVLPFVEQVIDARHALYEGRRVRRKDLLNAIAGGAKEDTRFASAWKTSAPPNSSSTSS